MDIRELEYFKVICDQKSITKAAHILYMSQQGLSRVVKNLEKEFGTTLLVRKTSGIELTRTGAYLYSNLPAFLQEYDDIRSNVTYIEKSENHEIELLSAYGIIRLVTPECLEAFTDEHPGIRLVCHEYPDREVERRWKQGQGNVAFTVGNNAVTFPGGQQMEQFEIKLLVNRQHPLADRASVSIRDLKGERIYLENTEFNIHQLILERCRAEGFEPEIAFGTSGFSLCHKLVSQNKGISVTVDFIFDDMTGKDLVMIPFSDGPLYWTTWMMTRTDKIPNEDVLLFGRHVTDWMEAIRRGTYSR